MYCNRTEWSTIQEVIGRVIWNYERDYPSIVHHEVLLPINRNDKKARLGNLLQPLMREKIIGLLNRLYKQQQNSKKEPILACLIDARMT